MATSPTVVAEDSRWLCSDPFFDPALSWNTDDPDLTSCFRKTFLLWTPCALFWLMVPFHIRTILQSPAQHRSSFVSSLSMAKTLFAFLLIVVAVVDLAFWCLDDDVFPVDILDPVLRLLTFSTVLALIQAERVRGVRTSPVQFLFFLLYLLLGIVNVYSTSRGFVKASVDLLPLVTRAENLDSDILIKESCCKRSLF